jgi:heme/copper-type cytochrome/quinol oxidase subunit 3
MARNREGPPNKRDYGYPKNSHAEFSFAGNIYGATFFMATGFHGFHVLVGTIFLIVYSGPLRLPCC